MFDRFPKSVWYTHKDNHQETTRLTAEEKGLLLEIRRGEMKRKSHVGNRGHPNTFTGPSSP